MRISQVNFDQPSQIKKLSRRTLFVCLQIQKFALKLDGYNIKFEQTTAEFN